VTTEEGEELAAELNFSLGYMECAALMQQGFKDIFDTALRAGFERSGGAKDKGECSMM